MRNERVITGWTVLGVLAFGLALWTAVGPALQPRENLVILWAVVVTLWIGIYLSVSLRLNVPFAITIYLLARWAVRLSRWLRKTWCKLRGQTTGRRLARREKKVAQNVFQLRDFHRLGHYEVVLGYHKRRPIKADISRLHWLMGGTTGGGKTNMINLILCQLFLNPSFNDDVHIIDLKGDREDCLWAWQPLIKSYVTEVQGALDLIHHLVLEMNRRMVEGWDGRIFLIFDEVATGTWAVQDDMRRAMRTELGALTMRARSAGVIVIAATQHPRYDVLDKVIAHNLRGKICLPVTHRSQAEVVLAEQPPSSLPRDAGQFLVRDQRIGLKRGMSLLVDLPGDVNKIVTMRLMNYEDPRLDLYRRACENLGPGQSIPGIQKMHRILAAQETEMSVDAISVAYRNFSEAGAWQAPTARGQPYRVGKVYVDGLTLVATRIRDGAWQEAPPPYVDMS